MTELLKAFFTALAVAYWILLAWYGARSLVRHIRKKRAIKRDMAGAWVYTILEEKHKNLTQKNNEKKEINTL